MRHSDLVEDSQHHWHYRIFSHDDNIIVYSRPFDLSEQARAEVSTLFHLPPED